MKIYCESCKVEDVVESSDDIHTLTDGEESQTYHVECFENLMKSEADFYARLLGVTLKK